MKPPKPVTLALAKLGQLLCRHRYDVLVLHTNRMFLRCDACGRESVGFVVGEKVRLDVGQRKASARP